MERKSNYIDWMFNLEEYLNTFKIEYSDYDEFHVKDAITETENIIEEYRISGGSGLTESMIDDYMYNAIRKSPDKRDYYETISSYVKKRLLQH